MLCSLVGTDAGNIVHFRVFINLPIFFNFSLFPLILKNVAYYILKI